MQRVCVFKGCALMVGSATTTTCATADVADPQPEPFNVTTQ